MSKMHFKKQIIKSNFNQIELRSLIWAIDLYIDSFYSGPEGKRKVDFNLYSLKEKLVEMHNEQKKD